MTIEKLSVFAETGDKNTNDLILEQGFPSKLQPARQWMNWLFNKITLKINELVDSSTNLDEDKVNYTDIVDNLTTNDSNSPLSAKMGQKLSNDKLNKSDLAMGDAPVFACRAWVNFNGVTGSIRYSGNISSVTSLGGGLYQLNYIIAMPDANYSIAAVGSARGDGTALAPVDGSFTTTSCQVRANFGGDNTIGSYNPQICCVTIFR